MTQAAAHTAGFVLIAQFVCVVAHTQLPWSCSSLKKLRWEKCYAALSLTHTHNIAVVGGRRTFIGAEVALRGIADAQELIASAAVAKATVNREAMVEDSEA